MSSFEAPNEIRIIRVYDAPLKVVWGAWADPEQVGKWWGPRGFTLTTYHKDMRTGGTWRYTMHGPDGTNYENTARYLEVIPYSKLVYDHGGHEDRPPLFRVTVLFSEVAPGKTRMEMTSTLPTAEAAVEIRKMIKKASGESTWDRFAEYLEKQTTGAETFVIARAFDAPLERMFDVWSDPQHLARWSGPKGAVMNFIENDVRPGGAVFYAMGEGDGRMYGLARYEVIERPRLIVYTQQFVDADRRVVRHPLSSTWPETMLTTIAFEAEGPGRTRVSLTWRPKDPVLPAEIETFQQARPAMTQGWNGSFDQLEDYLRSL